MYIKPKKAAKNVSVAPMAARAVRVNALVKIKIVNKKYEALNTPRIFY